MPGGKVDAITIYQSLLRRLISIRPAASLRRPGMIGRPGMIKHLEMIRQDDVIFIIHKS